MTTAELIRISKVVSVSALATAAGIPRQTLHSRMRNGSAMPPEHSAALDEALRNAGLALLPRQEDRP